MPIGLPCLVDRFIELHFHVVRASCALFSSLFFFNSTALLSGTLKTYQRAACDEEAMTLKCPPGTTISVEHAQYGRVGMYGISKCNSSVPPMIAGDVSTNHTCIAPQSLQVCANEIHSFRADRCRSSGGGARFPSLLRINVTVSSKTWNKILETRSVRYIFHRSFVLGV